MKRFKTRSVALPLVLAAGLIVAACGGSGGGSSSPTQTATDQPTQTESPTSTADPVRIAAPIELTGPVSAFGVPYSNAMQLAVEEINAAGGIKSMGGAPLELDLQDTQSDPEVAVRYLREMQANGATVSVGPLASGAVLAVKPVLQSINLPWIGGSVDNNVTEDNEDRTMWRVVNRFATWADATMDFILDARDSGEIEIEKIGIVTISISPGPDLAAVLEARAKAAGLDTFMISYDPAETRDFSNIVASLRDADPDLITGLSYPGDSILFAEAVTLQEWQPEEGYVWIAGGQYLNSFRAALGERTVNWMDASYGGPITGCAATEAFAQKYLDRFGEPLVGLALAGPATIQVIANALEIAGSADVDAFKEAMATLEVPACSGLYTMAGSVKFDAKGDNIEWVPTIIQHEGEVDQVAVWPQDVAARAAIWPARP